MAKKTVVIIPQEGLGSVGPEDRDFGVAMMDKFLGTVEDRAHAIIFYTDGVKLTCEGAKTVPALRQLEKSGVRLLCCKTCLDHFKLIGKHAVGEVGSMDDIVALILEADSVVTV